MAAAAPLLACLLGSPAEGAAPDSSNSVPLADQSLAIAKLNAQVDALQAEVSILKARLDTQISPPRPDSVQPMQISTAVRASPSPPPPPTPKTSGSVETSAPHAIAIGAVTITPGGFVEVTGLYRQHFMGSDISTNFGAIPFPNNRVAHQAEGRFTARQSRLSLLATAQVKPDVRISAFFDADLQGGAQTANSNESNSYTPRLRNFYATIDRTAQTGPGLHFLAGQAWSLATMTSVGISARSEVIPTTIDGQFVPGFVWARQPQVRIAADFLDHRLWAAASLENPQTTIGGVVPPTIVATAPASAGFDTNNKLSLNHVPDVLGKLAYDADIAGRHVHVEAFALYRTFSARNLSEHNENGHSTGYGGGIVLEAVPRLLELQFSTLLGRGIGRYGTSQLPDIAFSAGGAIHPLRETMMLAGATLHATPMLDVYGYAGLERSRRGAVSTVGGALFGYGNPDADDRGCTLEGETCSGDSREIRQLTFGLWQKVYDGSFGRAQAGLQYSLTQRFLFSAVGGAPEARQNMGLLAFRYFPFR